MLDSFDRWRFGIFTLTGGIPFFLFSAISFVVLRRANFQFSRIQCFLAKALTPASYSRWNRLTLFVILLMFSASGTFLIIWSSLTTTLTPSIVGCAIFCLSSAAIFACYGCFQWIASAYRIRRSQQVCGISAAMSFAAYIISVLFTMEPISFLGISCIFLASNSALVICAIYLHAKEGVVDFDSFLLAVRKGTFRASASAPRLFLRLSQPSALISALYVISIGTLIVFASIVSELSSASSLSSSSHPGSSTTAASATHGSIGWIISITVVSLDMLCLALFWSQKRKQLTEAVSNQNYIHPRSLSALCLSNRFLLIVFGQNMWFLAQCLTFVLYSTLLLHNHLKTEYPLTAGARSTQSREASLRPLDSILKLEAEVASVAATSSSASSSPSFFIIQFCLSILFLIPLAVTCVGGSSISPDFSDGKHSIPQWTVGIAALLIVSSLYSVALAVRFQSLSSQIPIWKPRALFAFAYILSVAAGVFLYGITQTVIGLTFLIFSPLLVALVIAFYSQLKHNGFEILEPASKRPVQFGDNLRTVCNRTPAAVNAAAVHRWVNNTRLSAPAMPQKAATAQNNASISHKTSSSKPAMESLSTKSRGSRASLPTPTPVALSAPLKRWSSPQTAPWFIAMFCGGLSARDYRIVGLLCSILIFIAIWGVVLSFYATPSYAGWNLIVIFYCLFAMGLSVVKYFGTRRYDVSQAVSMGCSCAMWLAYFVLMILYPFEGKTTNTSIAFGFAMVLIPVLLFQIVGLLVWRDNRWAATKFVIASLIATAFLLIASSIILAVAFSPAAGVGLLCTVLMLCYLIFLIFAWVQNRFFLPVRYRRSAIIIISLVITFSVVAGTLNGYFFLGISVGILSLFIGLLSRGIAVIFSTSIKDASIVYSRNIFPVFQYSALHDRVTSADSSIQSLFIGILLSLIWGSLASIFLSPQWIGLAVVSMTALAAHWFSVDRLFEQQAFFSSIIQIIAPQLIRQMLDKAVCIHLLNDSSSGDAEEENDESLFGTSSINASASQQSGLRMSNDLSNDGGAENTPAEAAVLEAEPSLSTRTKISHLIQHIQYLHASIQEKKSRISRNALVLENGRIQTLQEAWLELAELDTKLNTAVENKNRFEAHFQFLLVHAALSKRKHEESELLDFLRSQGLTGITIQDIQDFAPRKKQRLFHEFEQNKQKKLQEKSERVAKRQQEIEAQRRRDEEAKAIRMGLPLPLPTVSQQHSLAIASLRADLMSLDDVSPDTPSSISEFNSHRKTHLLSNQNRRFLSPPHFDTVASEIGSVQLMRRRSPSSAESGADVRLAHGEKEVEQTDADARQLAILEARELEIARSDEEIEREALNRETAAQTEEDKVMEGIKNKIISLSAQLDDELEQVENLHQQKRRIALQQKEATLRIAAERKARTTVGDEEEKSAVTSPECVTISIGNVLEDGEVDELGAESNSGVRPPLPPIPPSPGAMDKKMKKHVPKNQTLKIPPQIDLTVPSPSSRATVDLPSVGVSPGVYSTIKKESGLSSVVHHLDLEMGDAAEVDEQADSRSSKSCNDEKAFMFAVQRKRLEEEKLKLEEKKMESHSFVLLASAAMVSDFDVKQENQQTPGDGKKANGGGGDEEVHAFVEQLLTVEEALTESLGRISHLKKQLDEFEMRLESTLESRQRRIDDLFIQLEQDKKHRRECRREDLQLLQTLRMEREHRLQAEADEQHRERERLIQEEKERIEKAKLEAEHVERRQRQAEEEDRLRREDELALRRKREQEEALRLPPSRKDAEAASLQVAHDVIAEDERTVAVMQKRVQDLIRECQRSGQDKWLDPDFPRNMSSVHLPNAPSDSARCHVEEEWKSSEEIVREAIRSNTGGDVDDAVVEIFSDSTSPEDIIQGGLGDCWFLSALSVLAMYPERVKNLFITQERNSLGIYCVRFFKDGRWRPVLIDDFFPVDAQGRPAFSCSREPQEIWVMLLEKAYAKLHSCYEAIVAGQVHVALVDLTGGVGEDIDLEEDEVRDSIFSGKLWLRIQKFVELKYMIGAGSPAGCDSDPPGDDGIVKGHAYALLDAAEIDGIQLVKIRNPWGNTEWTGDWSDDSPLWDQHPRIRNTLRHASTDDGAFWMPWADFTRIFHSIYVCRLFNQSWFKYQAEAEWKGDTAGGPPIKSCPLAVRNPQFWLTINMPTTVFISLSQEETRGKGKGYHHIGFWLMRKNGNRVAVRGTKNELVHSSGVKVNGKLDPCQDVREISEEVILEPSPIPYTLTCFTARPGMESRIKLIIYADSEIKFTKIPDDVPGS